MHLLCVSYCYIYIYVWCYANEVAERKRMERMRVFYCIFSSRCVVFSCVLFELRFLLLVTTDRVVIMCAVAPRWVTPGNVYICDISKWSSGTGAERIAATHPINHPVLCARAVEYIYGNLRDGIILRSNVPPI